MLATDNNNKRSATTAKLKNNDKTNLNMQNILIFCWANNNSCVQIETFAHTYVHIHKCIGFVVFDSSSVINKLNTYIKHTAGVGGVSRGEGEGTRQRASVKLCS